MTMHDESTANYKINQRTQTVIWDRSVMQPLYKFTPLISSAKLLLLRRSPVNKFQSLPEYHLTPQLPRHYPLFWWKGLQRVQDYMSTVQILMMHFVTFGLDGRIENSAPGPSQNRQVRRPWQRVGTLRSKVTKMYGTPVSLPSLSPRFCFFSPFFLLLGQSKRILQEKKNQKSFLEGTLSKHVQTYL